jgi:hypothetical protein
MYVEMLCNAMSEKVVAKTILKCIICVLILYFFHIAIYPIIFWITWLVLNHTAKLKNAQTHIEALQKEIGVLKAAQEPLDKNADN